MNIRKLLCLTLCITLCAPFFCACASKNDGAADTAANKISALVNSSDDSYTFTGTSYTATRTGSLPKELAAATITADSTQSGSDIPTDTSFTLTTAGAVSDEQIKQYITVTPSVDYTVSKTSDTSYKITPDSALDSGAVYRFNVTDSVASPRLSFAFQTAKEFKLYSTLPADLSTDVPTNTGIELRFTEPVGSSSPAEYITLEPAAEFTVKLYPDGKTIAVIPTDILSINTVYTVTVKAGLTASSGRTLAADYTFKFRTAANSSSQNSGNINFMPDAYELTFNTAETPVYKWRTYIGDGQNVTESDAHITIWRYPSAEALVEAVKAMTAARGDAYFSGTKYEYPTDKLEQVADYTVPVTDLESSQYNRYSYAELQTDGRGFYLCQITLAAASKNQTVTHTYQAIVQVTDLCLYTENSNGSLLLWSQGTNGLDASGATVSAELFSASTNNYWNIDPVKTIYTPASGTADGDGLCYINSGDADCAYIIVKKGSDTLFRAASLYTTSAQKSYFSTVFTDREVYFADDTVNFHGFLRDTRGGNLPDAVYLTVNYGGSKLKLDVAADGSFSGSYKLESYAGWGVSLSFTDADGNSVINKYITVTQEEKPIYTATLTFDKFAYTYGEVATVTLDAAFFDGTPAPGLKFELSFGNFISSPVSVTTDAEGKAVYTFTTGALTAYSTDQVYLWCSAQLTGYEGTSLYLSASALYFHSDVRFANERVTPDSGDNYISLTLDNYDKAKISALTSADDLYTEDYPKNIIAEPADGSVNVTLTESWYEEVPSGTVYDPITKLTSKTYNYEQHTNILKNYNASFANGKLRLDYIKNESDHWYYYTVTYTDAREGNKYSYTIGAVDGGGDNWNFNNPSNEYYSFDYDSSAKSVGQLTDFAITYGDKKMTEGKTLYTVYTDDRESAKITFGSDYSLEYKSDYIVGMQLYYVYFNGKSFVFSGVASLYYDYAKNSSLALEITADKAEYKPGETATVSVRVTDKATGLPVGTGPVTLAVVDEACFALGEQTVDPAAEFYGTQRVMPYVSRDATMSLFSALAGWGYYYAVDTCAMESGAGVRSGNLADSSKSFAATGIEAPTANQASATTTTAIREIFSDNPVFTTTAAKNGTATFTFIVPDNITSWRLTAVAESQLSDKTGDVKLGASVSDTVCTLPFFVNAVVNSQYIVGDDITASARVYGSALENGAETVYSVKITDTNDKVIFEKSENGVAGGQVFFDFGKLDSGNYNLTLAAVCGKLSDGVKLSFKVIESGVLTTVVRELAPSEISTLVPAEYPVALTFYNSAYENWLELANRVMSAKSERADSLAAYYIAGKAVSSLFGGGEWFENELEAAKTKLASYGVGTLVPLLSYDTGDAELSALICAAAPDALTDSRKSELITAFNSLLDSGTSDDITLTAAYLGLAALGQPVLGDLRYLATHYSGLSLKAQLYVCAGLAVIGDYMTAYSIYAQLRDNYSGADEGGLLWFAEPDSSTEDRIAGSAAALLSASLIMPDDADALAAYITTHTSSIGLYVLQLAAYVRTYAPADADELSLSYSLADGEVKTAAVGVYNNLWLTLDKRDFEAFKLVSADEGIAVRAVYTGTLADATEGAKPTEQAKISKKIDVYDSERGLYKVTLSYSVTTDRDWSCLELTDLIPSGARYFYTDSADGMNGDRVWAYMYNDNQTMRGSIFVNNYINKTDALSGRSARTVTGTLTYIFRTAIPGEYIAEAAFLQNRETGCWAQSDRTTIDLK
jgi:Large extracellular alpha-helical protein